MRPGTSLSVTRCMSRCPGNVSLQNAYQVFRVAFHESPGHGPIDKELL